MLISIDAKRFMLLLIHSYTKNLPAKQGDFFMKVCFSLHSQYQETGKQILG